MDKIVNDVNTLGIQEIRMKKDMLKVKPFNNARVKANSTEELIIAKPANGVLGHLPK